MPWFQLAFPEAIAWFRDKANVPTETYRDIEAEHRAYAFSVSGVTSAEVLQDIRSAVDDQIENGVDYSTFKSNMEEIAQSSGWMPAEGIAWRSALILSQNVREVYSYGRYEQMTDPYVLSRRPYWEWDGNNSSNPRPLHLAWNGIKKRANDPWFLSRWPPAGFGCKCFVLTRSAEELYEEFGDDWIEDDDGEGDADPGFRRDISQSLSANRTEALQQTVQNLPANLRPEARAQVRAQGYDI